MATVHGDFLMSCLESCIHFEVVINGWCSEDVHLLVLHRFDSFSGSEGIVLGFIIPGDAPEGRRVLTSWFYFYLFACSSASLKPSFSRPLVVADFKSQCGQYVLLNS